MFYKRMLKAIQEDNFSEFVAVLNEMKAKANANEVEKTLTTKNEYGTTLLHEAAEHGQLETVQLLVKHEVSMEEKNLAGKTPVDLAIENNHTAIANFLNIRINWQQEISKQAIEKFPLDATLSEVTEIFNKLHIEENDQVVLVIGDTGVGKGVFINYLAGCNYEQIGIRGQTLLDTKPLNCEEPIHVGRNPTVSDTLDAKAVKINGINFIDTAGFEGTREDLLELRGMLSTKLMLQRTKNISILYVIDMSMLEAGKLQGIVNVAKRLDKFLKSQAAQYASSIRFVITKTYSQTVEIICQNYIAKNINTIRSGQNSVKQSVLNLLEKICDTENMLIVPNVFDKGESRTNIFAKLNKLAGIESSAMDFSAADNLLKNFEKVLALLATEYNYRIKKINGLPKQIAQHKQQLLSVNNDFNLKNTSFQYLTETINLLKSFQEKKDSKYSTTVISAITEQLRIQSQDLGAKNQTLIGLKKDKENMTLGSVLGKALGGTLGVGALAAGLGGIASSGGLGALGISIAGSIAGAVTAPAAATAAASIFIGLTLINYQAMQQVLVKNEADAKNLQVAIELLKSSISILEEFIQSGSQEDFVKLIKSYQENINVLDELIEKIGDDAEKIKQFIKNLFVEFNITRLELTTNMKLFGDLHKIIKLIASINHNEIKAFSETFSKELPVIIEDIETDAKNDAWPLPGASASNVPQLKKSTQWNEVNNLQQQILIENLQPTASGANQRFNHVAFNALEKLSSPVGMVLSWLVRAAPNIQILPSSYSSISKTNTFTNFFKSESLSEQKTTNLHRAVAMELAVKFNIPLKAILPVIETAGFNAKCDDLFSACDVTLTEHAVDKVQKIIADKKNGQAIISQLNPILPVMIDAVVTLGTFALAVIARWYKNNSTTLNAINHKEQRLLGERAIKVMRSSLMNELKYMQDKLAYIEVNQAIHKDDNFLALSFLIGDLEMMLANFKYGKATVSDLNDLIYTKRYIQEIFETLAPEFKSNFQCLLKSHA